MRANFYLLSLLFFLSTSLGVAGPAAQAQTPPDLTPYPWLYLRHDQPLEPDEAVVSLIAVGDVMLGREVAAEPGPFVEVTPWLSPADLTLGNLEAVIGSKGPPQPGIYDNPAWQPYRLQAPVSAVMALQQTGFDLLSLANNHALDFGPLGLAATVSRLQTAGLAPLGAGPGPEAASQPLIRQVGSVRLAFLAFTAVPDPAGEPAGEASWRPAFWQQAEGTAAIAAARRQADGVVVSIHWGREYQVRSDPAQRAVAQVMVEAGADLVVGHHPHVAQEVVLGSTLTGNEVHANSLVAYSLGNFVFDQGDDETGQGLALRAFFDQEGLRAVQALPVWAGPQPRLLPLSQAETLLARIKPVPRRLSFTCDSDTCRPVDLMTQPSRRGLFWAGEIDLTGDGLPEKVRRAGQQLIIYSQGSEVWRGDPTWQVVDLALGDPNDDGRWEALLALWKPDEAGIRRSHPFIIGYRRGFYQDIWGGSTVVDPIYEVELGDIDGDNIQELIVLEASGEGLLRAVTVWDWYGWGFSLRWRSQPGPYQDLIFSRAEDDRPPFISVAVVP